jgi:hypothetical protein
LQLLARAAQAGEPIGALCAGLYQRQGQAAVRRIQGVLALLKGYGLARVSDACAAALELQVFEYRFVRRYLEHRCQPPVSLCQIDPLIRQLNLYRDLIEERTKDNP